MSAAIQIVDQPVIDAGSEIDRVVLPRDLGDIAEMTFNNVTVFETASEQRARRATSQLGQLKAEVSTLRTELFHAERTIAQYEQLLRNAMLRERELRAEIVRDNF